MIKKFVSKALLTVALDKKAREKVTPGVTDKKPAAGDPLKSIEENAAIAARAALERAERDLSEKRPLTAGRSALIQQAMLVRNHQAKLLDELPPAQKEKLQVMAVEAFGLAAQSKPDPTGVDRPVPTAKKR